MKQKTEIDQQVQKQLNSGNITSSEDLIYNMLQDIRNDVSEIKAALAILTARP